MRQNTQRKYHGDVRIGISGWRYPGWRGQFYPPDLRQKDELAFASSRFNTIEINGTFYSMQRPSSFATWAESTPADFVFSVKGPRFISHMLKLARARTPLANFFASGVLRLGAKLGPIVWQLPPNLRFDAERLQAFFDLLPRNTDAAVELAKRHDAKVKRGTWLKNDGHRKIRYAIEVRHETFVTAEFVDLLRQADIAVVCADSVDWPIVTDVTSDFAYCRLHGSEVLYASGYDAPALRRWARRITNWASGAAPTDQKSLIKPMADRRKHDVFVYFDNDAKTRAPFDAMTLQAKINRLFKN